MLRAWPRRCAAWCQGGHGGLPLKLLWGLLDLATIVVLWSGLVLWWRKQKRPQTATRTARALT
jgi:uncharacterized iron-regulated membrane protein